MRNSSHGVARPVVAISGMGAVTPFGLGVATALSAVTNGDLALQLPERAFSPQLIPVPVGEVRTVMPANLPRLVALAVEAGREACSAAALSDRELAETDLVFGSTVGLRTRSDWQRGGTEPCAPVIDEVQERYFVAAQTVANVLGLHGRCVALTTACSSGANTVLHGWTLLATGRTKRVLCIGVDELSAGLTLSFLGMGALSRDPCRPYRDPVGTSLAEAAAAVVLEIQETAIGRGATSLAVVRGAACSADATHMAHPDPQGAGAQLAMRTAMRMAGTSSNDVAFVSGHGTGTAANDAMETVLQRRLMPGTPLTATKGLHGHAGGASSLLETVVAVGLINAEVTYPEECSHPAFPVPTKPLGGLFVKNAFAMGGLNTSLVVGKEPSPGESERRQPGGLHLVSHLAQSGTGWVGDDSRTTQAALSDTVVSAGGRLRVWQPEVPATEYRRLDALTKMTLAALASLLEFVPQDAIDDVGLYYATDRGPLLSWLAVDAARGEGRRPNPMVTPNLSFNAAVSRSVQILGLHGPCIVYTSGGASASAFDMAVGSLELGAVRWAALIACDESAAPHETRSENSGVAAALLRLSTKTTSSQAGPAPEWPPVVALTKWCTDRATA